MPIKKVQGTQQTPPTKSNETKRKNTDNSVKNIFADKNDNNGSKENYNTLIWGGIAAGLAGYAMDAAYISKNSVIKAGIGALIMASGIVCTIIGFSKKNGKKIQKLTLDENEEYEKFCKRRKEMQEKIEENNKYLEDVNHRNIQGSKIGAAIGGTIGAFLKGNGTIDSAFQKASSKLTKYAKLKNTAGFTRIAAKGTEKAIFIAGCAGIGAVLAAALNSAFTGTKYKPKELIEHEYMDVIEGEKKYLNYSS